MHFQDQKKKKDLPVGISITKRNFLENIFDFKVPGLGLIVVIFSIIIIGFIGSIVIKSPINAFFKRILKKAPLLETIYSSVKDLMGAFIGKKKGFKQAVFVKIFDNSTIERIGFITNEDLEKLKINDGRVLVYIPHSYNFSGNLYVVEKKYITPIDACLLYTSPSPRDRQKSRMPSSA